jgi:hypothetical protein
MTTNVSTNAPLIGQPMDRTDGILKVTGEARYAAEFGEARIAHAVLVTSTISSGSIASIDASRAQSLPGVLLVMTYQNAPRLPNGGRPPLAPPAGRHLSLLQDNQIHYSNEPVAVVVADTLERATDASKSPRSKCASPIRPRPACTTSPAPRRMRTRRSVRRAARPTRSAATSMRGWQAESCASMRSIRRRLNITTPWNRTPPWRIGMAPN